MRALIVLLAFAVVMACGEQSVGTSQTTASPSPFGTATLSATDCNFEMPNQMPLGEVRFKLVNQTQYDPGRFSLGYIHEGHTFQEVLDYWNGPNGQTGAPSFTTQVKQVDVSANGSGAMVANIAQAGSYAFHCGYFEPSAGKVKGFWHELKAASSSVSPTSSGASVSVVENAIGNVDPPGLAYQDIVKASVTLRNGSFVLIMDVAAPIPPKPVLPDGMVLATWAWAVDTDVTTNPSGFPFLPGSDTTAPPEFMVYLVWDRTTFNGILIDRRPLLTGGTATTVTVPFSITGNEVSVSVDSALLGKPSNFWWRPRTADWNTPLGSSDPVELDVVDRVRWES